MDLSRAIGKFAATSRLLGWKEATSEWEETGVNASLTVFDRFITQRTFGQKKRILLTDKAQEIPSAYEVVMLQGGTLPFIVESAQEDIYSEHRYNLIYLVHQANTRVDIMENTYLTRASGAKEKTGSQIASTTWADIERFSGTDSREFDDAFYTINLITLPKSTVVTSDNFLKVGDMQFSVDEVYSQLDTVMVKGRVIGETP